MVLAFVVNVVFGNWVHNNTSHNKSSLYSKTAQTERVLIFLLATTITEHPLPNLMGHFAVGSWPSFVVMKSLNQRAKTKKQKTKQSTVMLLLYQNFICKVRLCLDFFFITLHSIFITHHSSLKIPQLSTSHPFGYYFSFHHLNFFFFTFCGTHTWAIGQRLLLAYLPHPHFPPFSSLLISFCHHHSHNLTQKLHSQINQRLHTPQLQKLHSQFPKLHTPPNQKKRKKKKELSRNNKTQIELFPTELFPAPTTELPNWRTSFQIESFPTEIRRCCGCQFRHFG